MDEHPAGLSASPVDAAGRAAAYIVLGRILLHETGDDAKALSCFEQARDTVPQDGRALAALAEYYRLVKDDGSVRDLNRQAISVSPDLPEGYIGMALSCEGENWWNEAEDWYNQAVEVILGGSAVDDPLAGLGHLLAPVSGALYLQLAHAIWKAKPAAGLAALEQAIKLGISGSGPYPERPAYELEGEVLESLGRSDEAAGAFFKAGRFHAWESSPDQACILFERANALDQNLVPVYWSWADALLMASYVSKPPYVDRDKLEKGLDIWHRGVQLAPPNDTNGWPYLTRSIIAQQLARLPGLDRWKHCWESVAFVEQALLLDPLRSSSWVLLGKMQYTLGNQINALHATETALLSDPEDVRAVEERLFLLTNLHQFPEARSMLARRSEMKPADPTLVNAIEAHLALYESVPDVDPSICKAALDASDAAISTGADMPWVLSDRATLLRLAGRSDEARKQYEELWQSFESKDVNNLLEFAKAAILTENCDSALEILDELSGDPVSGLGTVQLYFGFCRLLQGDLESAQSHFENAVHLARTAWELDDWILYDFDSPVVLQLIEEPSRKERAEKVIEEFKAAAVKRRTELQPADSPQQELHRLLDTFEDDSGTPGWNWIGANASLARLHLEAQDWQAARQIYRKLKQFPGRYFTAQQGLEQALVGSLESRKSKSPVDLRRATTEAGGILEAGEISLPDDCTPLTANYNQRSNIERRRRLTRSFGQSGLGRLPAVTPIAIEAAENLGTLLLGEVHGLDPQFAQNLTNMRSELDELLGFRPPAVRIRINESDLPEGMYLIMINEIPLVSGHVDPDKGLCRESVEGLALHGIKGQEAVNPADGSPCSWVNIDDWKKARDAGYRIWTPSEYIVLHLSAVIRKNSTDLVDLQAVAELLQEKSVEHDTAIGSARGGLPRFTSVIQALLAEEVPIHEMLRLCDSYLEHVDLPTCEIPEKMRCLEAVRSGIPGNTPDSPVYRLGEDLCSLVGRSIRRDGEAAVLAIEPVPTQDALNAVRNKVANRKPSKIRPAIVVEDWRVRPFVRKLVELEFPQLSVLSRSEAVDLESREVLGTIEMNPNKELDAR